MEKEVWTTPTLVTLARGEPQEAILLVCKSGTQVTGPNGYFSACAPGSQEMCMTCFYGPAS